MNKERGIAMASQWIGDVPKTCNLCGRTLGTVFIDGNSRAGGWAIMCGDCHKYHGYGLGVGRGQMYKKTKTPEGTKWMKVEVKLK